MKASSLVSKTLQGLKGVVVMQLKDLVCFEQQRSCNTKDFFIFKAIPTQISDLCGAVALLVTPKGYQPKGVRAVPLYKYVAEGLAKL